MKLALIGDVHGMFTEYYLPVLNQLGETPSIQIGDMGVGMFGLVLPEVPKQHKFIRGNHDSPEKCRAHPNYLGEFGYIEEWDLFYIGGAFSVDGYLRTWGIDWWDEEELGMKDANAALALYEEKKPRIVVSHDCPEGAKLSLFSRRRPNYLNIPTRTNQLLQAMFELWQPSFWYFGHHHISQKFQVKNTQFKCLGEVEVIQVDI
jgi:hypothetical protein